jgi:neutral ceramidase
MTEYLKAGVAELEFTDEAEPQASSSTHPPLGAKALVLSSGNSSLAIITTDLHGLDQNAVDELRRQVSQRCGLDPEAVMVICPPTRHAPHITPLVGWPGLEQQQIDEVLSRVPDLVSEAQNGLQAASLGVGHAELPHLIYNHRLMTRNMKAVTAWLGVPENEVLKPEGPVDPEFYVVVLRDGRGWPLCLLWNLAADNRFLSVDGATQGKRVSAALPYLVQQELDRRMGKHVPAFYLGGCGGNVSYSHGLEQSTDAVASAVMAVQLETPCDPDIPLDWRSERMILPVRDYSEFWDRPDIELKYPEGIEAFAQELECLRDEGAKAVSTHIQVFRLGSIALVGLAGIPFVEFALSIKTHSPFRTTLVASHGGGHSGYVIPQHAFGHGGFESWTARSAKVGPGGGEFMAEEAISLLEELAGC